MDEEESFEVRRRRHAQGYAPQQPAPAMRTWKPVLTEQEAQERARMIAERIVPF